MRKRRAVALARETLQSFGGRTPVGWGRIYRQRKRAWKNRNHPRHPSTPLASRYWRFIIRHKLRRRAS